MPGDGWSLAQFASDGGVRLDHRRATEFTVPDEERFIQQAALFQIHNQRRTRLVGDAAIIAKILLATPLWSVPTFAIDVG